MEDKNMVPIWVSVVCLVFILGLVVFVGASLIIKKKAARLAFIQNFKSTVDTVKVDNRRYRFCNGFFQSSFCINDDVSDFHNMHFAAFGNPTMECDTSVFLKGMECTDEDFIFCIRATLLRKSSKYPTIG